VDRVIGKPDPESTDEERVIEKPDPPATLAEAGIDKNLAHRAHQAAVPPARFEDIVQETKQAILDVGEDASQD
jgi:hypothetical protein